MTQEEFDDHINEFVVRREILFNQLLTQARPLVETLLDAGRTNSAKPLQQTLFEFDVIDQEMRELITQNKELLFERLFARLRKSNG